LLPKINLQTFRYGITCTLISPLVTLPVSLLLMFPKSLQI